MNSRIFREKCKSVQHMPKKYFHVKYKLKSSFINLSFTILFNSILQTYCNSYYGNVRFNFYITSIKMTSLYSYGNILQFVVMIIFEITKSPVTRYSYLSLLTEIRKIPHHLVFAPSKVTSSIEKYKVNSWSEPVNHISLGNPVDCHMEARLY